MTSTRPAADRRLRSARAATFAYFGLNGFVLGIWVVHIPSIEHRTAVSHATLGWLLLLLGLGAYVGMRVVGPLSDRYSPKRVVPAGAVFCSLALLGPALAGNAAGLACALIVLGFGNGWLDVAMNTHAVQVEARYGRPVMSAFHAVFSVGGFLAALVGAQTLTWHWTPRTTLPIAVVLAVVVAVVAAPTLLAAEPLPPEEPGSPGEPPNQRSRRVPARIWWLATLAFALMLTEGVANDWSTLAARDGLGVSAAVAALAYGAFSGAMTVGRFSADRVAAALGPAMIVRAGASVAVVALAVIAVSPWIALTIAGWALLGLGLSGCVPQLFSAAGHTDPRASGANVSRVAGIGYLGMLAGPAVIGPLTHVLAVQHTFVLPMVLCAVAALSAGVLRERPADDPAVRSTAEQATT